MRSAYGSNGGLHIARVQYGLASHYDAAGAADHVLAHGVAVATSSAHRLERVIDQISGDLLTHVIADVE